MKFELALPELKGGKKIRYTPWRPGVFIQLRKTELAQVIVMVEGQMQTSWRPTDEELLGSKWVIVY